MYNLCIFSYALENNDTISVENTGTLRIGDTLNLEYPLVGNVTTLIHEPSDISSIQNIAALEDINVVGEEEIIIGTVVEDISSEGLKSVKTFEEMNLQRNEEFKVQNCMQVGSMEDVSKIENFIEKEIENFNR